MCQFLIIGTGNGTFNWDRGFQSLEVADDFTTLLKKLFNGDETLQKSPLFIVAESYGGKFAVTLVLSALKAIEAGTFKLKLGGVALGDSWISPANFVFLWGPFLKDVSRLDDNGFKQSQSLFEKIRQLIQEGQYKEATNSRGELEGIISSNNNEVVLMNIKCGINIL
ncbi:hypothetical protein CsatA_015575 [Cannabis sativa]